MVSLSIRLEALRWRERQTQPHMASNGAYIGVIAQVTRDLPARTPHGLVNDDSSLAAATRAQGTQHNMAFN